MTNKTPIIAVLNVISTPGSISNIAGDTTKAAHIIVPFDASATHQEMREEIAEKAKEAVKDILSIRGPAHEMYRVYERHSDAIKAMDNIYFPLDIKSQIDHFQQASIPMYAAIVLTEQDDAEQVYRSDLVGSYSKFGAALDAVTGGTDATTEYVYTGCQYMAYGIDPIHSTKSVMVVVTDGDGQEDAGYIVADYHTPTSATYTAYRFKHYTAAE